VGKQPAPQWRDMDAAVRHRRQARHRVIRRPLADEDLPLASGGAFGRLDHTSVSVSAGWDRSAEWYTVKWNERPGALLVIRANPL
jgi:hypothetical protein